MSDFIVEKLSKSVGDKTVFKDISFIIHDLDRIGLIGVNGTGKTTLLDVLSGVSGFDGDVSPFSAKNDYQIGYLTQDPDFDDSKTVLDTVLSSDLKEIQLIREYELIMLNYSDAQVAKSFSCARREKDETTHRTIGKTSTFVHEDILLTIRLFC